MDLMDFGIEMETVEEKEYMRIPGDYEIINLKDLLDGDKFTGIPFLTEIQEREWNGNKKVESQLLLINHEDEEGMRIPLSMKSMDNIQKDIHYKSKLFGFLKSLFEVVGMPLQGNKIKQIDFEAVRELVNNKIEDMTIEIVTKSFVNDKSGEYIEYNEIKVVDIVPADE